MPHRRHADPRDDVEPACTGATSSTAPFASCGSRGCWCSARGPLVLTHRAGEPFSQLVPASALLARAAHWCRELDHPACDGLYVALAERDRATLITADQRLLRKLHPPRPGLPAAMALARLTDSASAPP